MSRSRTYLEGMFAGASLAYFLDPERGARRRSLVRDQLVHLGRKLEHGLDAAATDARQRSLGAAAKARRRFRHEEAPDAVVEARVRSQLGRVVSHPRAIEVSVLDGKVTLAGAVLASELDRLLATTRKVRGVREVENHLGAHPRPGGVPGLQGNGRRPEPRFELLQDNWTPSVRLLVGALGASSLLSARSGSGLRAVLASALGGVLLARAATNLPTRRLVGIDGGRESVRIQKTLHLTAPVEEVWALWSHFENFPRFMAHLAEVRITAEGRSHWVAKGPAGSRFEWDAVVTELVPNETLAWKSVKGSSVANTGRVRFQPTEDGGTRLDLHLSYNPPAGVIGHFVASLFGSDAKRAMDEDMVRLKSLLEEGKASVAGRRVTREAVV